jgi:anti-anti-sigma factor
VTAADHVDAPELKPVQLLGMPLAIAARSTDHHATLMRELALVDAADDSTTTHGRLLALASELQSKYSRFGEAQRARAEQAMVSGERTLDLHYDVPPDLANDIAQMAVLLDEVDEFCRGGELVTLVTPPDVAVYRRWLFDEFCAQLRDGAPPTRWVDVTARVVEAEPLGAEANAAVIAIDEDLDLEGSARIREVIARRLEQGVTDLTVDLHGCQFVDSVGISLLLTTLARLRDSAGSLVLVHVNDSVRRTLRHAGILDLLVRE